LSQREKLFSWILFHFLTIFPKKRETMLVAFVSFFNKLATEERNNAHDLFLIMASKRIILWKENMSRDKTRSWLPRDIHYMEEECFGRNTC
jgi:hypothetical protein